MPMMKTLTSISIVLAFLASVSAANAGCYADYKAKQDDPLRLHYGVTQLSEATCTKAAAHAKLESTLSSDGWKLLNVITVFGDDELSTKESNAGQYFLRY
ncbi:hypothetical protein RB2150_13016 [Rhodobacteraceae bacterium HTCC2150]|nr:hypothetical protein RB2150_13016 [Rhodobacteraceae bacterium HTCC2150]